MRAIPVPVLLRTEQLGWKATRGLKMSWRVTWDLALNSPQGFVFKSAV